MSEFDKKISALTSGGASQAGDEYVIARGGANYKIAGSQIAAAATSVGTLTSLTVSGDLTVDTSTLKVDSANNRVGVKKTPGVALDIQGLGTASGYSAAGNAGIRVDFGTANNGVINMVGGGDLGVFRSNSSNAYDVGISFGDNSNRHITFTTANAEKMRLDASGNFGVGTTSPYKTITVGDSDAKAWITAGGVNTNLTISSVGVSGSIKFQTGGSNSDPSTTVECGRFNSVGYFKASNTGSYTDGATAAFHVLQSDSAGEAVVAVESTNASYTGNGLLVVAKRNTTNNTHYPINYFNRDAGAMRFRVADSGAIATAGSITLGSVTPATSGVGVQFPATQSASSDANTLDDYEEGTWTPNVGGTATYTTQQGRYTKIGRIVIAEYDMTINNIGTGSTVGVDGLPFTCASNPGGTAIIGYYNGLSTAVTFINARIDSGATGINHQATTGTSTTAGTTGIFTSGSRINGTAVYAV